MAKFAAKGRWVGALNTKAADAENLWWQRDKDAYCAFHSASIGYQKSALAGYASFATEPAWAQAQHDFADERLDWFNASATGIYQTWVTNSNAAANAYFADLSAKFVTAADALDNHDYTLATSSATLSRDAVKGGTIGGAATDGSAKIESDFSRAAATADCTYLQAVALAKANENRIAAYVAAGYSPAEALTALGLLPDYSAATAIAAAESAYRAALATAYGEHRNALADLDLGYANAYYGLELEGVPGSSDGLFVAYVKNSEGVYKQFALDEAAATKTRDFLFADYGATLSKDWADTFAQKISAWAADGTTPAAVLPYAEYRASLAEAEKLRVCGNVPGGSVVGTADAEKARAEAAAQAAYEKVWGNAATNLTGSAQADYDRYVGAAQAEAAASLAWAAVKNAFAKLQSLAEQALGALGLGSGSSLPTLETAPDYDGSLEVQPTNPADLAAGPDPYDPSNPPYAGASVETTVTIPSWQRDRYFELSFNNTWGFLANGLETITGWDSNVAGCSTTDPTNLSGGANLEYPMGMIHEVKKHAVVNISGNIEAVYDYLRMNAVHQPHYAVGSWLPFQTDDWTATPRLLNALYGPAFDLSLTPFDILDPNGGDPARYRLDPATGQLALELPEQEMGEPLMLESLPIDEPQAVEVGGQEEAAGGEGASATSSKSSSTGWREDEVWSILTAGNSKIAAFIMRKATLHVSTGWFDEVSIDYYYKDFYYLPFYQQFYTYDNCFLYHIDIYAPAKWDSHTVAKAILEQFNTNWLPEMYQRDLTAKELEIMNKRIDDLQATCKEIAANLQTGIQVTVGLLPGGTVVLMLYDLGEKNYTGAVIGVAAAVPWGNVLKLLGDRAMKLPFAGKTVTFSKEVVAHFATLSKSAIKQLEKKLAGKTAKQIEAALKAEADNAAIAAKKAAEKVEKTASKLPKGFDPAKGFKSFDEFKDAVGAAGNGEAWHHVVEQTINSGKFAPELLHNPANLFKLPHGKGTIHNKISGYYSSKQGFSEGLTVREWLSRKSFKEQFEFGIKTIKQFGGSRYLPPHLR